MTFSEAGPVPAQGNIAQQIFWYTAFTADMVKPGLPVMNADGTPKWRMAPSPHGAVLEAGHEARLPGRRFGDLVEVRPRSTAARRPGCIRSSSSPRRCRLKKSHVGLTFIREVRHLGQVVHRARAEARRPDRVLPLAGARAVDPDRQQRARLSEAGAIVVAEHRRCVVRCEDAAGRRWTRWPQPRTR